jgi:indole-3-glycerol phosphate synthase
MAARLQEIIAAHRKRIAEDARDVNELIGDALLTPARRDFEAALRSPGLSVIAEIKRRSPSAGDLNVDLDPAELAGRYVSGGAAALSVVTDEQFFGGHSTDLREAHDATEIPVLRKDFIVDERDLADTRTMGADAALLIVSELSDSELKTFAATGRELGLSLLFEAHDIEDIERAANAGAKLIGVNQRNLNTFEVDSTRAVALASHLPDGVVKVAESGIQTVDDAKAIVGAGYDAVLVGSALVTSSDPETLINDIRQCS